MTKKVELWRQMDGLTYRQTTPVVKPLLRLKYSFSAVVNIFSISRRTSKCLHGLTMFLSVAVAVPGIWSVWESHSLAQPPIPHLFSLHSWLGLSTMSLMAVQLLFGLVIFLLPCAPSRIRGQYHHVHVFFGLAFIILATAASLIGLTEEALFSLSSNYPKLPGKGILLNLIGLFLTIFTATVTFITTKPSFKPLD